MLHSNMNIYVFVKSCVIKSFNCVKDPLIVLNIYYFSDKPLEDK